jgi:hypothetical protein
MAVALSKPPVWMVEELRRRTGLPMHECRRALAAATLAEHKRIGGDAGGRYPCDPAEDDPATATVLLRAALEVDAELAGEDRAEMGFCHLLWRCKQRVLRERYGVEWSRPDQLSGIVFD